LAIFAIKRRFHTSITINLNLNHRISIPAYAIEQQ
jgi:hypothetical protein